jgi:hypothetical protein
MSWGSADLVPTSRLERTEWVLGSVVPLLLVPDSRSHYTNRSMHSSISSPVFTLGGRIRASLRSKPKELGHLSEKRLPSHVPASGLPKLTGS